ncbi:MAG: hypothetical protein LBH14_00350 [Desulfobulbaceae bacterium]|jgi:hypothetical protein|nr:hypothetical protein [Desulfobulbaceae bacterium]
MSDYITVLDAAAQIEMSPERFANLLREKRDVLPVEINHEALANNPYAMFAGRALEKFYEGIPGQGIGLFALKIHRLDWEAYKARCAAPPVNDDMAATLEKNNAPSRVNADLWKNSVRAIIRVVCSKRRNWKKTEFQDAVAKECPGGRYHTEAVNIAWQELPDSYKGGTGRPPKGLKASKV